MPPRNPSELARLEAERQELLASLRSYKTKSEKVGLLRELRKIERTLGIEPTSYNDETFFRL